MNSDSAWYQTGCHSENNTSGQGDEAMDEEQRA